MAHLEPTVGCTVDIPVGRGIVRFIGPTSFSAGKWVGVELSEPKGKNDGSVQGVSYFHCKPLYGVFVRASQVKVVNVEVRHVPTPPVALPSAALPSAFRPTLGHQRTSSAGIARAPSLRSGSSSSRSVSPAKPSAYGPNSTAPVPPGSPSRITRVTQPASLVKRVQSSSIHPRPVHARQGSLSGARPTPPLELPQTVKRVSSPLVPPSPTILRDESPSPPPPVVSSSPSLLLEEKPPSPTLESIRAQEEQEYRAKIRVLEAKRADDARHIRELETRLSEAESFVALRPKLQAKLNTLQTELIATRRALSDSEQLSTLAESRVLDAQEQLEMAMLDKEVAEERAEAAEAELEDLTERLAVVEVELDVLRDGGGIEGERGASSANPSLAYIQLEKHNERLKEALVRLRDLSQENDQEQRRRIAEMERDVSSVDELQSQHESTLIKLSNAETQIEDLKLQLDDALGAEEMLVQLTERNLMLGEKIEEMRITIEDLEALKELNDELEENHIETEKLMQEDLDFKDSQMRDQSRKIESLEDACQDLENTIGQFRELVMQLQADLDALRAQTQTAQHESATAASQTAAMLSVNLKLQSSASKNQARNIELELRKLEARESRELLSIVQPYLPQMYVETDSDATNCYLFFRRLAYKADLINSIVAQSHGLPDSLNGPVSEALVGVCEMRARISTLSTLCRRFAAVLRRCDVESFLNMGRIFPELAPMEKRIDLHIDLLRRDEFREMECVSDVNKMQAQFDHLAQAYFHGFEFDLGERELGYALSFEHDLDMFTATAGLTKTALAEIIQDDDVIVETADLDAAEELFVPLQQLLDQCKGAKVLAKKLTKRVEDLIMDSAALKSHLVPQLQTLNNMVPELVNFGISLAQQIMPHLNDIRTSKSPLQLATVLSFARQIAASTVGKGRPDGGASWEAVGDSILQIVREASALVPLALESENVVKISGPAPWVLRIDEIKASIAVNVEAERKVAQLNDEIQDLARGIKTRDQTIQESSVKIELMERRMEAVKKQSDTITDLGVELSKARKQERAYEEAMEQLQADLDTLEQENAKLKTMAPPERQASGAQPVEAENVPIEGSLETSHLLEQIDALRGAVRFLRSENSYLKGQDSLREIQALPPLPEPVIRPSTPPLEPSTLSDSDDSDSDPPRLRTPTTLRSLTTETKLLYRDVITFSSSPRVVDLSALNKRRVEGGGKSGKTWMPMKKTPGHQVWERKMEAERLQRRVQGLFERASAVRTA